MWNNFMKKEERDAHNRPIYNTAEEYNRAHRKQNGEHHCSYHDAEAKKKKIVMIVCKITAWLCLPIVVLALLDLDGAVSFTDVIEEVTWGIEDFFDDMNKEDDSYSNYDENAVHENPKDFNIFMVNGEQCQVPCNCEELEDVGFVIKEDTDNQMIEPKQWAVYSLYYGESELCIGYVYIQNYTDGVISYKDGEIVAIELDNLTVSGWDEQKTKLPEITYVLDIDYQTDKDALMEILGEPNRIYESYDEGEYSCYTYEFDLTEDYYSCFEVCYMDGMLYSITITHEKRL